MLPNAGTVETNTLQPNIAYIQLTKLKVFEEENNTKTIFEKNVNLTQFYFEMPFTQSGSAQTENVSEQYIKKTVLSVASSFPYMLKRQPVSSVEHKVVTPIEIAITSVKAKTDEVNSLLSKGNVEKNVLQALLQGNYFSFFFFFYIFLIFYFLFFQKNTTRCS